MAEEKVCLDRKKLCSGLDETIKHLENMEPLKAREKLAEVREMVEKAIATAKKPA